MSFPTEEELIADIDGADVGDPSYDVDQSGTPIDVQPEP